MIRKGLVFFQFLCFISSVSNEGLFCQFHPRLFHVKLALSSGLTNESKRRYRDVKRLPITASQARVCPHVCFNFNHEVLSLEVVQKSKCSDALCSIVRKKHLALKSNFTEAYRSCVETSNNLDNKFINWVQLKQQIDCICQ